MHGKGEICWASRHEPSISVMRSPLCLRIVFAWHAVWQSSAEAHHLCLPCLFAEGVEGSLAAGRLLAPTAPSAPHGSPAPEALQSAPGGSAPASSLVVPASRPPSRLALAAHSPVVRPRGGAHATGASGAVGGGGKLGVTAGGAEREGGGQQAVVHRPDEGSSDEFGGGTEGGVGQEEGLPSFCAICMEAPIQVG